MTIIVGVDGSVSSAHAMAWALDEARCRGVDVLLVHAWTYALGGHTAVAQNLALLAAASQELLDVRVSQARADAPDVTVEGKLVQQAPAAALVDASRDGDLLVVGSRGHGSAASLFVGSVADACVRHAHAPVVVIRPEAVAQPGGPIVVGVDGSECAASALAWAMREAALHAAPLTVLHAWRPPYATDLTVMTASPDDDARLEEAARRRLDTAVALAAATTGIPVVTPHLVRDEAASALLAEAAGAALLVVGTRGGGGFAGLVLGSVSRRCLHAAPCPVVVTRGEE